MFKKLTDDAILPLAQTADSAGYDVFANEDIEIHVGQTKLVPLGIALDVRDIDYLAKEGIYVGLYLRSSFGAKGLILPNGVGIIDIGYKDEIKQIIHNPIKIKGLDANARGKGIYEHFDNCKFEIKKGDRVGQLIFHKHYGIKLLENNYRKDTQRDGGFGSTGSK